MRLDNCAGYGQSKSETLAMTLLALPQLMKHVEDDFFLSVCDSWTRIGNSDQRET